MPSILVFAGSSRIESLSKRLARAAARSVQAAGGEASFIDLADFEMPVYQGDVEAAAGLPPATRRLQALLARHDGLLIVSPEYNGSMPPLLVNVLAWCSRVASDDREGSGLAVFADKPAAIMATSPGALGGLRALFHLRDLLAYLGMVVIPQQFAVARAHEAFAADASLSDPSQRAAVDRVAAALVRAAV